MDRFTPKKRSLICMILCVVAAIICFFFTNISTVHIITLLMLAGLFLIMYLIFGYIPIPTAHILFYLIILLFYPIIMMFPQSTIALKLDVIDWEKNVKSIVIQQCQNGCSIDSYYIYDYKNNKIYEYKYLFDIEKGNIISDKKDISYTISFKDKCVTKKYNEKFVLKNGNCFKSS